MICHQLQDISRDPDRSLVTRIHQEGQAISDHYPEVEKRRIHGGIIILPGTIVAVGMANELAISTSLELHARSSMTGRP